MKYLVTIAWGFVLSQVTFFLGSILLQTPANFTAAVLGGLIVSLGVMLIQHVFIQPPQATQKK